MNEMPCEQQNINVTCLIRNAMEKKTCHPSLLLANHYYDYHTSEEMRVASIESILHTPTPHSIMATITN